MNRRFPPFCAAATLLLGAAVFAQENTELEAVPEPPPLPERMQSGESIEPDVTIVRGEKQTVMEYRVNGQLRAVKVIPDVGPPYYLVDANGDGTLDSQRQSLGGNFLMNQWVIFSW